MIEDIDGDAEQLVATIIGLLDQMKNGDVVEIEMVDGSYLVSSKTLVAMLPSESGGEDHGGEYKSRTTEEGV